MNGYGKHPGNRVPFQQQSLLFGFVALVLIGGSGFLLQLAGAHPERAWRAFLVNFLLWSAVAQGAVLFPMVLHITKARWGEPLKALAESFVAFFPLSFGLFLLLFLGKAHLFPWLGHETDGKDLWLDLPFLFFRDLIGLAVLYGLGLAYVYNARRLRRTDVHREQETGGARSQASYRDVDRYRSRMTLISILYIIAYAFVLTLISFDLVMSMEPHWVSTLFGAYHFVKAFYIGLGTLIILASACRLGLAPGAAPASSDFHDVGKLFFAFCLLWADFFYCQLVVIWYGNIPEETVYVIRRTMLMPWKVLAWTVFALCFMIPFVVLLNKQIKARPMPMILLCSTILFGMWLEHLLLLGPALSPQAASLALGPADGLIALGFVGLMGTGLTFFFRRFPEAISMAHRGND